MKISSQQLISLPVVTESGQELGQIKNFNIDIDSQSILEYLIKPDNLIAELINGEFIISRGQVISITQDKIIVSDNISQVDPFKKINKIFNNKKSVVLNKE